MNAPVSTRAVDREPGIERLDASVAHAPRFARPLAALFRIADAVFNRVYTSEYNPIYRSGSIAIAMLVVLAVTGTYLFLFYKTGAPWESVSRIEGQVFSGRWVRALHRYAGDACLIAVVIHALRMLARGSTWGPRVLAWVTGMFALGLLLISGWTGLVLAWDTQALELAAQGARILDLLPLFSEPISHAFVSDRSVPPSFFFANLLIHLCIPLLFLVLLLWVHMLRAPRPALLPGRALAVGVVAALFVVAVIVPVGIEDKASLDTLSGRFEVDAWYEFWLPAVAERGPLVVGALFGVVGLGALLAPAWWRPPRRRRPEPSAVSELHCRGCRQCAEDCPYEAIQMVPRSVGKGSDVVARVAPDLCVSCGVCAGSCDVLRVGPPTRTGRDQLLMLRTKSPVLGDTRLPVIVCEKNASYLKRLEASAFRVIAVSCAGALHEASIRSLLKKGAPGVAIVACATRDCHSREGPKWLEARLFQGRDAALHPSVDRDRVLFLAAGPGEEARVLSEVERFSTGGSGQGAAVRGKDRPGFARELALRALVSLALAVGIALPSTATLGEPAETAALRLSWKFLGGKQRMCRTRAPEELEKLPQHMRTPMECTERFAEYRLVVVVDGVTRLERRLDPVGARADRPPYVLEDLALDPGPHALSVLFDPEGFAEVQGAVPRLALHERFDAEKGRVHLVEFDHDQQALVLRRAPARPR